MKTILIIFFASIVMISCKSNDSNQNVKGKKFLYVEISETNVFNEYRPKIDTVEFVAESDSLAYLEAYEKYCVSQQASVIVAKQLKAAGSDDEYESTIIFELFNENCEKIDKDVVSADALEKIAKRISSIN